MRDGKKGFAAANIAFLAVFIGAAAVQLNDPDPWRWVAIYVSGAVNCLLCGRVRWAWIPSTAVGLMAAAWSGVLFSSVWRMVSVGDLFQEMHMKGGAVEVGREAVGLMIVGIWMFALVAAQRRYDDIQRVGG